MSENGDKDLEMQPMDRPEMTAFVATILLAARVIALRGQPVNHGDVVEAVSNADTLMTEVERRVGE